jgi:hypothetical protein
MFEKLKTKWKVNGWNLLLILITFSFAGSSCGRLASFISQYFLGENSNNFVYALLWVMLATLLWPLCVIIISIPLGQFTFFENYLQKVFARLKGKK